MSRRDWFLTFVILGLAAAILLAMGRNPLCTCGTLTFWVGERDSPMTSQMLADWYSLSHVVHGFLFYLLMWLGARRWPVGRRFLAALVAEAAWEVTENTPWVIDRYRATTAALGYTGDSIINSLSDMAMMALGFFLARKLRLGPAILVVLALEVFPLFTIRDNLTLNVWQLIVPSETLQAWQSRR